MGGDTRMMLAYGYQRVGCQKIGLGVALLVGRESSGCRLCVSLRRQVVRGRLMLAKAG